MVVLRQAQDERKRANVAADVTERDDGELSRSVSKVQTIKPKPGGDHIVGDAEPAIELERPGLDCHRARRLARPGVLLDQPERHPGPRQPQRENEPRRAGPDNQDARLTHPYPPAYICRQADYCRDDPDFSLACLPTDLNRLFYFVAFVTSCSRFVRKAINQPPQRDAQHFEVTQHLCLVDRHRPVEYPVQADVIPSPQPRSPPSRERATRWSVRQAGPVRNFRMRKAITRVLGLGCAASAVMAIAQAMAQQPSGPAPNADSQYRLGPDSLPQKDVPKGEIRGPFTLPSKVYPGTQHTYWVYVPAQYDPAVPAALMVFQDGQAFKDENGRHAGAERDG